MAQQKSSPLQAIQFLCLTYLLEPPLLWTALPSQRAVLCFPEHATTGTAGSKENCSCETAVTFTTAMCYQQRKNLGSSLSKSPNLKLDVIQRIKSVQVFWVCRDLKRVDRKPSCLQERRETRYFCHGLWEFLAEVWHATQPGASNTGMVLRNKALEGNASLLQYETQYVPLAALQLFRRRLWPTIHSLRSNTSATMDLTSHL